jgi:hypothetical protein
VKHSVRVAVWIGLLILLTSAFWRVVLMRRSSRALQPFGGPWPPIDAAEPEVHPDATPRPGWVEPTDGTCPSSHPIKAKLASSIFHPPGTSNYTRTRADRCYESDMAAMADGFTRAKH